MDRKKWYREHYLKSEHWKQLRKITLLAQGNICQRCSERKRLQVHHKTYERLWKERPGDLEVLCTKCHKKEHRKKK